MSCTYPTEELTADDLCQLWPSATEARATDVRVTDVDALTIDPTLDPACGAKIAGLPCQRGDAELWFADSPADLEAAKSHCQACPVRLGCLAGALDRREPWGVWGGEIIDRGTIVARKRPRGRPPKQTAAA